MPKLKDQSIQYRILMILLEGDKRFTDLLAHIKRATLSNELRKLENDGLIKRTVDNESRPPKVSYSITDRGIEFVSVIAEDIIAEMENTAKLLRMARSRLVKTVPQKKSPNMNYPSAKSIVSGMIATKLEHTKK